MTTARPTLTKLVRWSALTVVAAAVLPVFLLAGLLILVAPLPQLAIHMRWCYDQPGPLGWILLLLGAAGATAVLGGLVRGRAAVHRAGFLLVVAPVVGVALHRAVTTGDWGEIPLLGAFLFSGLLIPDGQ